MWILKTDHSPSLLLPPASCSGKNASSWLLIMVMTVSTPHTTPLNPSPPPPQPYPSSPSFHTPDTPASLPLSSSLIFPFLSFPPSYSFLLLLLLLQDSILVSPFFICFLLPLLPPFSTTSPPPAKPITFFSFLLHILPFLTCLLFPNSSSLSSCVSFISLPPYFSPFFFPFLLHILFSLTLYFFPFFFPFLLHIFSFFTSLFFTLSSSLVSYISFLSLPPYFPPFLFLFPPAYPSFP